MAGIKGNRPKPKAGLALRPKKGGRTESRKNHTYQSFSQKIADIKIDQAVRIQRNVEDENAESYLRPALEKWMDSNLTTTFTEASRELLPLTDSLPHILHYSDTIADILLKYIEKGDPLAVEPLLDLLVQFARDINAGFEKHFSRTFSTITTLISKNSDVAVWEWAFNSLAFLFKYLARILVRDLRPIYDQLSILLGKGKPKPYIVRFAAEAASFLLRKAKSGINRQLFQHISEDLESFMDEEALPQYLDGIALMCSEACSGVNNGVHSKGTSIFEEMLRVSYGENGPSKMWSKVCEKTLIGLIHHCTRETFIVFEDLIISYNEELVAKGYGTSSVTWASKLVYIMTAVRKGSRISNWDRVGQHLTKLLEGIKGNSGELTELSAVIKCASVFAKYAEFDALISRFPRIADSFFRANIDSEFLTMVDMTAKGDAAKLSDVVASHFQKFVNSKWAKHDNHLALVSSDLRKLHEEDGRGLASLPGCREWAKDILSKLKKWTKAINSTSAQDDVQLAKLWKNLDVLNTMQITGQVESDSNKHISELYVSLLNLTGSSESRKLYPLLGQIMELSASKLDLKSSHVQRLVELIPEGIKNKSFLRGLYKFIDAKGSSYSELKALLDNEAASEALVIALSHSNHDIRLLSLRVMEQALHLNNSDRVSVINIMETIENAPLTVTDQRETSASIRKLAGLYETIHKDKLLGSAIPSFLFGLMTKRFAPIWDDAESALVEVMAHKEEAVAETAFRWLFSKNEVETSAETSSEDEDANEPEQTAFVCSNLTGLESTANKCIKRANDPEAEILQQFRAETSPSPEFHLVKSQALRILTACPQVAEKRHKTIVPLLLDNWRTGGDDDVVVRGELTGVTLTRVEKKGLLTVFSKFTNPRGLTRQEDVRKVYMRCLTSGDEEVQKLALKCLLTWKDVALVNYKDHLSGMLEESRLREELTVFLQPSDDESTVRPDDRQELMTVLLRILYGKSVSRKGSGSSKRGVEARRSTILKAIANLPIHEQELFVAIMLEDLPGDVFISKETIVDYKVNNSALSGFNVATRKLAGFLRMAEDFIKEMGAHMKPLLARLIDVVIYCLLRGNGKATAEGSDTENDDPSVLKTIRQGSLKCLSLSFDFCPGFDWKPYMRIIFDAGINDNLVNLPTSSSQAPSGMLLLFNTWASHKETVGFLRDYNSNVIDSVVSCLVAPAVKDQVIIFVLKMLSSIVELEPEILVPSHDKTVMTLGTIVRGSPHKEVFEKAIDTISRLAAISGESAVSVSMLDLCSFLLDQPTRRVHPKIKQNLLRIVFHFVQSSDIKPGEGLFEKIFNQISNLFGYFFDRESRIVLSDAFAALAKKDSALEDVATLLKDLNSWSRKRLDEPDFEKRLAAYAAINDSLYSNFTARQWRPLLYNMLFYVKDQEELPIRTSSSFTLRRFIDACKLRKEDENQELFKLMEEILLPALYNGARERSELIRMEIVSTMNHLVTEIPDYKHTRDMVCLLEDGDEEANFFLNVLHIQQHRRARATRRLASHAEKTNFDSSNTAKFLLPLVEHFIFEAADDAHNLATDAISAVGALVKSLNWSQFRAITKRYVDVLFAKEANAKTVVRLLAAVVDCLTAVFPRKKLENVGEEDEEEEEAKEDAEGDVVMDSEQPAWNLTASLPKGKRLSTDIKSTLGSLSRFLHDKDEETVALRVPATIVVVKLLMILPDEEMRKRLPGVLTDTCHILRSRSQDSRDMTRKTLAEVAQILGGAYFSFIVKELRGALLRGYQLHVLSFSLHSLLVSLIPKCEPGDLDYCLSDMVQIIMDDIFGAVGTEKDSDDYISKMKEVKSSKSYDSMELLARSTTIKHLPLLLHPIGDILMENLNHKSLRKVDELLRRINTGVVANTSLQSVDLLTFCYELIREGYKQVVVGDDKKDRMKKPSASGDPNRFLVNLKVPRQSAAPVMHSSHRYKLIRFAFDILRTTFQKHDGLMTPENVANFIPVIGDALLSSDEEVLISALRLLTVVIRVPLDAIDEGLPVFTKRALTLIKSSPSTNSELAQAALKLLTGIIRERKAVPVKDTTVAYLLSRIRADLEEPDRQGISFNFVKAVLSRKIVIPEVYEIMDVIATIMITNQTRAARELARAVYFQFFMDYPQGKDRLTKQVSFLVKNLDYVHASGRTSVLEFVFQLFTKIGDKLIQDILASFFVPLVMILINDDSVECKEMAGRLLKELFTRADEERMKSALSMLNTWIAQDERPLLVRAALQIYGIYFDVHGAESKKLAVSLSSNIREILKQTEDSQWEHLYFALTLWSKFLKYYPEFTFSSESAGVWEKIINSLAFPHAWIRLLSSKLVGAYFQRYATTETYTVPMVLTDGLEITEAQLFTLSWRLSAHLNRPDLSEEMGSQATKNLIFIAKVFLSTKLPRKSSEEMQQNEDEDSESEEEEEEEEKAQEVRFAIQWLVNRVCSIVRYERHGKAGITGRKFALKCLAAFAAASSPEEMELFAKSVIMPLYTLIEMPLNFALKELKSTAEEVLEFIKKRMTPTAYAKVYAQVREEVSQRRIVRKHKRSIQLVADPEKAAQKKVKKHDRKKVARKEKNKEHRDRRRGKNL